ncbi:MAG TPA: DNA-processing protein DprA [Candidatus Dormibacteraeota bacterium]|nr:DNA-processing protein DprA [Candidatus Dormibacteraeota bacterium]
MGERRDDADAPRLPPLRVRGRWPLPGPRVAIVGARRPTPYGEAVAERLAMDLVRAGVVVVSGLALGIDAAAHEGALAGGGLTVAVLGTGIDVVYPAANAGLAARILAAGGTLLSQFPDGTPPRRGNFPRRNWTMAALSDLVVVVEAAEGSGALITADAALSLNRTVMAVPGSVFSALSVGCHQLLRDGAGLVQNARDVLAELQSPSAVLDDPMRLPEGAAAAPAGGGGLLRHLSDVHPVDPGELARRLGLPLPEVLARLTRLELEGAVRRGGGGYLRVQRRTRGCGMHGAGAG